MIINFWISIGGRNMPTVSVILTSYNKPSTITKAIESVINQTFQDWELL